MSEPSNSTTGGKPPINWAEIEERPAFRALLASKAKFIWTASIFFVVYYFALPVLVGYFPELMKTKVGPVNLAYLFALSQFFMAWIMALVYVKAASGWDKKAAAVTSDHQ